MKMSSRVGICKYLTEYFLFPHVLSCFAGVLFHCMPWSFSGKTAVNLLASHKKNDSRAAHKALLMCLLLLCITRIITRVHAHVK